MYHSTGVTKKLLDTLYVRIAAREIKPGMRICPPILGLRESITVTLKYLRRNRVQADIAEEFGVSQPTVSRAISAVMPLLVQALMEFIPSADSLSHGQQFIIDGTLLPCWSWRSRPDLYSGKHKRTGMGVLVACTLDGVLSWISDPVPGSRHDNFIVKDSSVLDCVDPIDYVGDKGFVGNGMITPFKKPAGGMLLQWQKEFNSQVNKIRWVIEQKISHLKTWQSMNTDYRRPIGTFTEAISAVIALEFFRNS
jgi:DDE superfamily endonuclease/Helix-turn-helix of DDE superfamily endonuclease